MNIARSNPDFSFGGETADISNVLFATFATSLRLNILSRPRCIRGLLIFVGVEGEGEDKLSIGRDVVHLFSFSFSVAANTISSGKERKILLG